MFDDPSPDSAPDAAGAPSPRFDLSVFEQADVWVTDAGEVRQLEDLHPSDRSDLADWLVRHARHFYLQVVARALVGDVLASGRVPEVLFVSAGEWVASTPLFVALAGSNELAERTGPFWALELVARRLGWSGRGAVLAAAEAGVLLVVRDGSGRAVCPGWQFVRVGQRRWRVADGVGEVMGSLADEDGWAVALVLSIPAPDLDGRVPRDLFGVGVDVGVLEELEVFGRQVAREWRT